MRDFVTFENNVFPIFAFISDARCCEKQTEEKMEARQCAMIVKVYKTFGKPSDIVRVH